MYVIIFKNKYTLSITISHWSCEDPQKKIIVLNTFFAFVFFFFLGIVEFYLPRFIILQYSFINFNNTIRWTSDFK